ncbi:15898_t:CDS:1, partial [Cetraspora pellucida]
MTQLSSSRGPYIRIACENCRFRHKKCSGGHVCAYCFENNLQCIYNTNRRKRGPRTRHSERINSNHELP